MAKALYTAPIEVPPTKSHATSSAGRRLANAETAPVS